MQILLNLEGNILLDHFDALNMIFLGGDVGIFWYISSIHISGVLT